MRDNEMSHLSSFELANFLGRTDTLNQTSILLDENSRISTTPEPVAATTKQKKRFKRATPPASFDWSNTYPSVVNPVRNQGQCGSCWAFAAVGTLEATYALKTGVLKSFSEQQFVDCSQSNYGCNGGNEYYAFRDFRNRGSASRSEYPYTARNGYCRLDVQKARANLGFSIIPNYVSNFNDAFLIQLLYDKGPIATSIYVENSFYYYGGGIIASCRRARGVNHAVLLGNEREEREREKLFINILSY